MNKPFKIWIEDEETLNKVFAKMEKEGIRWWNSKDRPCMRRVDVPIALFVDEDNLLSYAGSFKYYRLHNNDEITPKEYLKESKEMTKSDLKDWMIVETAEHSIFLVDKTHGYLIQSDGHMLLSSYTDDLKLMYPTSHTGLDYSIVKVYETRHGLEFFLKLYLDGTVKNPFHKIEEDLNLIWERDEEPVEMTIAEVEKQLGIKNLKIIKENGVKED